MSLNAFLPHRRLEIDALECSRGERLILADVSLFAESGEVLVLRGPNGAGKSTLLMCMAGLLPFSGSLVWQGRNEEERPGTDMHFLSHLHALKPDLTVTENLEFWARLNGGDPDKIQAALIAARLDHTATFPAGVLSAGQTRRLSLIRLLLAPRPIWLLDEPTTALDSQGGAWVGHLIDSHIEQKGLVIVATHLDLDLKSPTRTINIGERS